VVVHYEPGDPLPGDEFGDADLAEVGVLVALGELLADRAGAAFDVRDHQPRGLTMASNASLGAWSTEMVMLKSWPCTGAAAMSRLLADWVSCLRT